MVQCYAPTNDTDDETKDQFHNQLFTILQARKGKDVMILMGDMNAKIGLEPMNENGERFAWSSVGQYSNSRESIKPPGCLLITPQKIR